MFNYPTQLMPTLVLFGELLEPEMGMLPYFLGEGAVAVDIGASIGTWSVSAARTGARVEACEPDPENLQSLERNCRDNGVSEHVSVHRLGLGASAGTGRVARANRRYLNRVTMVGADPGAAQSADPGSESFPILTLDEFARERSLDQIDVVKINTAGGEMDVVRGAHELLSSRAVGLMMVLDGLAVRPLLDSTRRHGYSIGIWDAERRAVITAEDSTGLSGLRRTPMTRYILLQKRGE